MVGDHDNEENGLIEKLNQLEAEEYERVRQYRLMMESSVTYHHYAVGDLDKNRIS